MAKQPLANQHNPPSLYTCCVPFYFTTNPKLKHTFMALLNWYS